MSFESPTAPIFRGLNLNELGIDECYINVTTVENIEFSDVFLYERNEDCDGCPYRFVGMVSLKFDTRHQEDRQAYYEYINTCQLSWNQEQHNTSLSLDKQNSNDL